MTAPIPDGSTAAAKAQEMHDRGYNCAQCVFLACTEGCGIPEETRARLMLSFGGGMGGFGEACGALSGALAALGLLAPPVIPGDVEAKEAHYARVKALGEAFREAAGAVHCPDLKPEDPARRAEVCGGYIQLATRLVTEALK